MRELLKLEENGFTVIYLADVKAIGNAVKVTIEYKKTNSNKTRVYEHKIEEFEFYIPKELHSKALAIIEYIFDNFEFLYVETRQKHKAKHLRNFIIFAVSEALQIPLYKILRQITAVIDGHRRVLSTNAVVKNIYTNYRIYQEELKLIL